MLHKHNKAAGLRLKIERGSAAVVYLKRMSFRGLFKC